MGVKVIYNMQWSALKSKQRMCTEFTADSRAYFFLMKNISCYMDFVCSCFSNCDHVYMENKKCLTLGLLIGRPLGRFSDSS